MQQAAIEASADAGYTIDRYDQMGVFWLARKTIVEYGRPARYGDTLEAQTWVSDFRRVQSNREYLITHQKTGEPVVRAQTNWAFLDKETLKPVRISAEMAHVFEPNDQQAIRYPQPGQGERPTGLPRRYHSRRRVQHYELDPARHVNNAIYLQWAEQAIFDACETAGFSAERMVDEYGLIFLAPAQRDRLSPTRV